MTSEADDHDDVLRSPRLPPDIHYHYEQTKNGNGGTAVILKISLAVCGFMLASLLAVSAFMWNDQLEFQRNMIERVTKIETTLQIRNE